MPKIVLTFRTSAQVKEKLKQLAKEDNRTVSNVVQRMIKEFLDRSEAKIEALQK